MSVSSYQYHWSSNFGINYKKDLIPLHLTNQSGFLGTLIRKNRASSDYGTLFENCILNTSNHEDVLVLSAQAIVVPVLIMKISLKLLDLEKCSQFVVQSVGVHNLTVHRVLRLSYLLHCTSVVQCRDSILKSIEKKLNSSDLNDYDLLMAASIYFNEQVCDCIAFFISFCFSFFCLLAHLHCATSHM